MSVANQMIPATFLGFGFGPIQAGLYLYEAHLSGNFGRLVVAYRRPEVVAQVRGAGGYFALNIAHPGGIERVQVGPIEMEDMAAEDGRARIVGAVAEAQEIATAVSSVRDYLSPGPGSVHRLLAEGLRRKAQRGGPRAVVYASENHTGAAEILETQVFSVIPEGEHEAVRAHVRFVNTVIGKMCRTVAGDEVHDLGLAPITPDDARAFLVESFRHILISKVGWDGFQRGLSVLEEKDDLTPFEEAKLYGHNATHALAAYLGMALGVTYIAELQEVPGVLPFLRAAALEESGAALLRRHGGHDPMFTEAGYRDFMEGLLARMMNPSLRDTVARVGRDPARKLGWDDRLVGTMRLVLGEGLTPHRHAFGAAAALAVMAPASLETEAPVEAFLEPLWVGAEIQETEKERVLGLLEGGRAGLKRWREAGFPHLEHFL